MGSRISLQPLAYAVGLPPESIPVGLIDDKPLAYVGQFAYAGNEQLAHATIAQDLLDAIDDALTPIFGGDWPHPLHVVTGLNARATQRDRIFKQGLPPAILAFVGSASKLAQAVEPPRAAGDLMLAAARMMAARQAKVTIARLPVCELPPLDVERLQALMGNVISIVTKLRAGRNPKIV